MSKKKVSQQVQVLTTSDYAVLGLAVAATLFTWYLYFSLEPAGPGLGPAVSSERLFWKLLTGVTSLFPITLWWMKQQYDDQHWRAEFIGVLYEEGKTYPFITTRRIVLWGLAAALFMAIGSVPFTIFDLGGLVIALISILWGPVDVFVISLITWLILGPTSRGMPLFWSIAEGFADAMAWGFCSFVFHRFIKPRIRTGKMQQNVTGVIAYLAAWWMGYHMWLVPNRFLFPNPAFLAEQMAVYLAWYPTCGIAAAIGYFVAISISKYVWPEKIHVEKWGMKDNIGMLLAVALLTQSLYLFAQAAFFPVV